jgi:hypothetical protein
VWISGEYFGGDEPIEPQRILLGRVPPFGLRWNALRQAAKAPDEPKKRCPARRDVRAEFVSPIVRNRRLKINRGRLWWYF